MSHDHVPGWGMCDTCGIRYPTKCPTCQAVHERIHHQKRRRRIKKEARA